ncbi:MAG TPA: M56 family metallopeptidase, partial [Pirellula sp.]|nr:M56 family metallopeptidase [Pirellula sp.]
MFAFSFWNPSDAALILGFNIIWQVTLILAAALMFASAMRRSPSVRYWVLCASLLLILLSPVSAIFLQSMGGGWLSIAFTKEIADPKVEPTAVVAESFRSESASSSLKQPSRPIEVERSEVATQRPFESKKSGPLTPRASTNNNSELKWTGEQVASSPVIVNQNAPEASAPRRLPTWLGIAVRAFGPWVFCIWSVGSGLMLLRLALGYCRLVAILRLAERNTDSVLTRTFAEAGQSLGLGQAANQLPELLLSDRITGPIAAGIFRPCVVLPERMVDRITSEQLRHILVHEMAHVIRRDPIVALMQNFVAALFWLHPLVRVLNRQLSQAREEVCDNYVLAATDAPSYSRTLLSLAELVQRTSPIPGTVGLFTSRWKLEQRIAGLLDIRRNRGTELSLVGCMFVVVTSLALVTIASIGTLRMTVAQAAVQVEKSKSGNDSKNSEADSPDHKSL